MLLTLSTGHRPATDLGFLLQSLSLERVATGDAVFSPRLAGFVLDPEVLPEPEHSPHASG